MWTDSLLLRGRWLVSSLFRSFRFTMRRKRRGRPRKLSRGRIKTRERINWFSAVVNINHHNRPLELLVPPFHFAFHFAPVLIRKMGIVEIMLNKLAASAGTRKNLGFDALCGHDSCPAAARFTTYYRLVVWKMGMVTAIGRKRCHGRQVQVRQVVECRWLLNSLEVQFGLGCFRCTWIRLSLMVQFCWCPEWFSLSLVTCLVYFSDEISRLLTKNQVGFGTKLCSTTLPL